jgi:branched-subunit amino acid aminotransferase/4-amino-4-deoxychorismate lyase
MNQQRTFGPAAGLPQPESAQTPRPRTALAVGRGEAKHLEAHLARLEAGATALGESAPWLLDLVSPLREWVSETASGEDAALRLRLVSGAGQLEARLETLPTVPSPYRVVPMPHPLQGRRSAPAVIHKGLSGPWSGEVLAAARRQNAEDALLLWSDGTLAETAIAAVALDVDGILWLPPAEGRVASLAERLDLPAWAEARSLRLKTSDIPLEWVARGQLWCLNAVRGIWPTEVVGMVP